MCEADPFERLFSQKGDETRLTPFLVKNSCPTPFAEIVAAVYDCRSSRLPSGFGCTNNSHSGKANEDVGAPAELGYPSSN
ncbi:MAG: hypothetical protein NTW41_01410 [Verrucomicrobia bacterium]|nr:hypothetical protein [Verrucomicrobiota bacterium]